MAAILFGRAGENQTAVQMFMALGEQQRAAEVLQKAGDSVGAAKLASMKPGQFETGPLLAPSKATAVGGQAVSMVSAQKLEQQGKHEAALQSYVQLKRFADAARMAKVLGRKADAAQLYADAGAPFEAAQAYLELGDTGKALENLCRVPAEDAQYRVAAAIAVRLATNLNVLDFRFEHFVGPYVRSGPRDAAELQVFDNTLDADVSKRGQAFVVVVAASHKAPDTHARCLRRAHAHDAVLDHKAMSGINAKRVGSVKKKIGGGF